MFFKPYHQSATTRAILYNLCSWYFSIKGINIKNIIIATTLNIEEKYPTKIGSLKKLLKYKDHVPFNNEAEIEVINPTNNKVLNFVK